MRTPHVRPLNGLIDATVSPNVSAGRCPGGDAHAAPALLDDEQALVKQVRDGDLAAFDQLFSSYYSALWAIAIGYLEHSDAATECVQDVFVWIWESRQRWHIQGAVRPYLARAVRNKALNYLRHERAMVRWKARQTAQEPAALGMGQGPRSPDQGVRDQEVAEAVVRAVQALPLRQREAFTLRLEHGLSTAAAAQVMGVSPKGVEVQLSRALKTLRSTLAAIR